MVALLVSFLRTTARVFAPVVLVLAALVGAASTACAAPPSDDEIAKAEQDQDRALAEAQRAGSVARVVPTYESRYGRQPTALNRYLYGRALFHAGDKAGALREMRGVAQQEDGFWHAHARIAHLLLEDKNAALARPHLAKARSLRPDTPYVLRVAVQLALYAQDWDLALSSLKRLDALKPGDEEVQMLLAEVHRQKGDWKAVHAVLRPLRTAHPEDRRLRYGYAFSAYRAGSLAEAAAEFEDLAKGDPQGAAPYLQPLISIYLEQAEARAKKGEKPDLALLERALDRMQPFLDLSKPDQRNLPYLYGRRAVAVEKRDWKGLAAALEALLPFADAENKPDLERTIAALEAGEAPGAVPTGTAPAPTDEERLMALVERCLSTNVATRRAALQEFHEQGLGWIPAAVMLHFHPTEEPDPECRAWVVKIVGALDEPAQAKIAGHALQDPTSLVRRVAAEVLGSIATPAGLLYLTSYVSYSPGLPLAEDAPEDAVQEYNVARRALVEITGYDDVAIGAPRWIRAAGLRDSWKRWETWLASPEGVRAKLLAIEDLVRTGETHPEWYLMLMVWDRSPEVAKAAYDVLLQRSTQPSSDPVARKFWPTFPRLTTKAPDGTRDLTVAESIAEVKPRIHQWWSGWLAERGREAQAPAGGGSSPAPAREGK